MALIKGEGPLGLIVCPSRELARQTRDVLDLYAGAISKEGACEGIVVGGGFLLMVWYTHVALLMVVPCNRLNI